MQEFINKYRDKINGTLSGFDRLVFRGSLRRLNYGYFDQKLKSMVAQGMEQYLWQNKILFKDYQDHGKRLSQKVKQASIQPLEKLGLPGPFLRNPSADKEAGRGSWPRSSRWRADWCARSAQWSRALRSNIEARTLCGE